MLAEWNLGDLFWGMLVFFFWFMAISVFIGVFADIFRRNDLSGAAKAGWLLLIFVLPFLGALIYMTARPAMTEQDRERMQQMSAAERRASGTRRPMRSRSSRASGTPARSRPKSTSDWSRMPSRPDTPHHPKLHPNQVMPNRWRVLRFTA